MTFISMYTSTIKASEYAKETFYEQQHQTLENISRNDRMVLLGDFIARVVSSTREENGMAALAGIAQEKFVDLRKSRELSITNTFKCTPERAHSYIDPH